MQCIFGFETVNPAVVLHKRSSSKFSIALTVHTKFEECHLNLRTETSPLSHAIMAFAMQTPMSSSLSFKSHTADARPFLAPRPAPVSRGLRTAIVPMAKGPSLKTKNNIAKVLHVAVSSVGCCAIF